MALAILVAIAATQVHASILRMATLLSRGLVFNTKTFSQDTQDFLRTPTEDRKVKKSLDSNYSENVLKKYSNHLRLRKVGWLLHGIKRAARGLGRCVWRALAV